MVIRMEYGFQVYKVLNVVNLFNGDPSLNLHAVWMTISLMREDFFTHDLSRLTVISNHKTLYVFISYQHDSIDLEETVIWEDGFLTQYTPIRTNLIKLSFYIYIFCCCFFCFFSVLLLNVHSCSRQPVNNATYDTKEYGLQMFSVIMLWVWLVYTGLVT